MLVYQRVNPDHHAHFVAVERSISVLIPPSRSPKSDRFPTFDPFEQIEDEIERFERPGAFLLWRFLIRFFRFSLILFVQMALRYRTCVRVSMQWFLRGNIRAFRSNIWPVRICVFFYAKKHCTIFVVDLMLWYSIYIYNYRIYIYIYINIYTITQSHTHTYLHIFATFPFYRFPC